jgi:hypothetical protein
LTVELDLPCATPESLGLVLWDQHGNAARRALGLRAAWSGLSPGTYTLEVDGRGFEPARLEVELPPGADLRERVAPRPLNRLRGEVLDALTLLPLAACEVRVETRKPGRVPHSTFFPWLSGTGGFCVAGVPLTGEQVRVHVRAPGFEPGVSDWLDARGVHEGVLVELDSTSAAVGIVAGRVLDAVDGRGVAGVDLVVVDAGFPSESAFVFGPYLQVGDGLRVGGAEESDRGHVRSGAAGAFRMEVDVPLRGRLLAYHPEYRLAESPELELSLQARSERIELLLERGASIRGRVMTSAEHVERPARLDIVGPRSYFTGVREDGTFLQGGLEDGTYRLQLNVRRRNPRGGEDIVPAASEIAVIEGGRDAEVTFHLGSGLIGTRIEGSVVLPGDEAISEWMVTVLDPLQPGRGLITTAVLGEDGTFVLSDVPAGELTLFAVGRSRDDSRLAVAGLPILVRAGELPPPVVVDASGPRVELVVPDHDPRLPLAQRSEILLAASDVPLLAGTLASETWLYPDDDGVAVLHGLPPGTYTLSLAAFEERARVFEVPADRSVVLEVVLR